jgi:hypothetical protein
MRGLRGYEFNPSEAGILVEIYLPKRAEYQETLYQALTEGFEVEKVKAYLWKRRRDIKAFLKNHYIHEGLTKDKVDKLKQMFSGYSMYEVDGVFYNRKTREIIEERTQVIRLIFRPNFSRFSKDIPVKRIIKEYLRFTGSRDEFLVEYLSRNELSLKDRKKVARLISHLQNWERDVALFVFGYVIYEICFRIKKLNDEMGRKVEEEIWITSFWNLILNRVVRVNG